MAAHNSSSARARVRRTTGLALVMALAAAVAAASASAAPGPNDDGIGGNPDRITPVIASVIPQRSIAAVRGSDGRLHVQYELMVTNTTSSPATLNAVRVRDQSRKRTLVTIRAADMVGTTGLLHKLDGNTVQSSTIPANASRILFVTASFKSRRQIPAKVADRFGLEVKDPFGEKVKHFRYVADRVPISDRRPPVLSPPLEGRGWLASQGCCGPAGHESAIFGLEGQLQATERYAIDWIKIAPDGRIYHGDPSVLTNWVGYGAKVKAMSSGRVVEATDGQPDQTPQHPVPPPFHEIPGNRVVIAEGNGLRDVYAHLVPGSVRVERGDHVRAGETIGRLGNSGLSSAPHLHFHVVNGRSAAASDGFPYTMDSFKLAGQTDISALGKALEGEAAFPRRNQLHPVRHHRQLPLTFTINDFPVGR